MNAILNLGHVFWKLSFSSFLHESVHVQIEYSDYCGIFNTKWFPDRVATKFYESFSQFQYIFRKKWGSGFVNLWFIMNIEDKIWKTNGLSRISELALKMLRRPLIKMWIFERKSSRPIEHLQYLSKSGKRLEQVWRNNRKTSTKKLFSNFNYFWPNHIICPSLFINF